ncbi:class F sortase [Streptomyces zagrosensis]|uniref:Class F sortase n=1 Tax=Streptomyces zagrosensis TaxID=1042984 RepID=A0A7W9Q9W1_9ACTN|nr:class F sortase [Streptomyces zagrosensis]MBB5936320.1 hypothetical protein [Streptomyces zagrosensis]
MSRARRRRLSVTAGTAVSLLAGGVFWAVAPASPGAFSYPPPAWAAGAAAGLIAGHDAGEGDDRWEDLARERVNGDTSEGNDKGSNGGQGDQGDRGSRSAAGGQGFGDMEGHDGEPSAGPDLRSRPPAAPRYGPAASGAHRGGPAQTAPPVVPRAPISRSRPSVLAIPDLSIAAPVIGLGLDRKGRLGTPSMDTPLVAGWHQRGPSPGERGTAVIVGHRDTPSGPAVFLELPALDKGDLISVTRQDGKTAVFVVDGVRTYEKSGFPDREVYGDTGRPELRLLTCGGDFHPKTGYGANVVVFAHLADVRDGAPAG